MSVTSWNQTPGALIRRGGYAPETAAVEAAHELTAQDRLTAKRNFDEAWRDTITVQQRLAEAGWAGAWIHLERTVAPELAPLYAQAAMAQTRSGVDAPGQAHQDPLIAEHAAIVRARRDAASRESAARLGPLHNTVG